MEIEMDEVERLMDMAPISVDKVRTMLPESLHEFFVERGPLGMPAFFHPLYHDPFFHPCKMTVDRVIGCVESKTERIQELAKEKNLGSIVSLYDKPYRLDAFVEWGSKFCRKWPVGYYRLLGEVWRGSENIHQQFKDWFRLWSTVELSGNATKVMDAADRKFLSVVQNSADESGRVMLFRGSCPKGKRGLSWSFSHDKAKWFSQRMIKNGKVWATSIPADKLLVGFVSRGESEVLPCPSILRSLKITHE